MAFLTLPDGVVRPYAAPPEVPAERLEMLRDAFAQTNKDPDFIGFARQHGLTLDYVGPDRLARTAKEIRSTPQSAVEGARELAR
jgi:tripartite-type tricarboxylate transporter receptor subunit TctC